MLDVPKLKIASLLNPGFWFIIKLICLDTSKVPIIKNWAITNWDTVSVWRMNAFLVLPLPLEAWFFNTSRVFEEDSTSEGYAPARKVTISNITPRKMNNDGWLKVKCNPSGIKSAKAFSNKGVRATDKIVAIKVTANVSLMNWKNNCHLEPPSVLRMPISLARL